MSDCYQLIQLSKTTRGANLRAELLAEAERRCTRPGAWSGFSQEVRLNYCMWKHMSSGICMNSMRTNCPKDTSCCPAAQHAAGDSEMRLLRPNQYACAKSPTFGLFCQLTNDLVEGNETDRPRCTAATCASFDWCADLADVPGLCLGDACQAYGRSLDLSVVIIVFVGLGLLLDFADLVMLCRPPGAPKVKVITNCAGACLKMIAYLFSSAGGLSEFVDAVLQHDCFNPDGREQVVQTRWSVQAFQVLCLLAMAGSWVLSPMTARWGHRVVGLPRVRSI